MPCNIIKISSFWNGMNFQRDAFVFAISFSWKHSVRCLATVTPRQICTPYYHIFETMEPVHTHVDDLVTMQRYSILQVIAASPRKHFDKDFIDILLSKNVICWDISRNYSKNCWKFWNNICLSDAHASHDSVEILWWLLSFVLAWIFVYLTMCHPYHFHNIFASHNFYLWLFTTQIFCV